MHCRSNKPAPVLNIVATYYLAMSLIGIMFYTMKDIFNVTNWYLETSLKYRSKLVRLSNGPLVSSSVELTHPDTAKVGLGSGMNM